MQNGPYVITYRKRRRKGGSFGVWVIAAIVVAGLIVGGVIFAQTRSGAAASPATLPRPPQQSEYRAYARSTRRHTGRNADT